MTREQALLERGAAAVREQIAAAAERAGQVLAVGSRCGRHPATRGEAREDVAGTLGGGSGSRGWAQDTECMTFVANTMKSQRGKGGGGIGPEETLIAAPLTSVGHPNSNAPGRRKEDDENLVASIVIPISGDAMRGEGNALTPSPDAEGRIRLRDPGFSIGADGDPAFTLSATSPGAVGSGASVRRLTPVECARLQGLPDDWFDGVPGTSDSKMYAGLGDAVTVPVAEWIGRRIVAT